MKTAKDINIMEQIRISLTRLDLDTCINDFKALLTYSRTNATTEEIKRFAEGNNTDTTALQWMNVNVPELVSLDFMMKFIDCFGFHAIESELLSYTSVKRICENAHINTKKEALTMITDLTKNRIEKLEKMRKMLFEQLY